LQLADDLRQRGGGRAELEVLDLFAQCTNALAEPAVGLDQSSECGGDRQRGGIVVGQQLFELAHEAQAVIDFRACQ
jgi:hypothetical protein